MQTTDQFTLTREAVIVAATPKPAPIVTEDYIRQMVTTNDAWATRAIVAIYKYQTDDEKVEMVTKHHNGVGFSGADATFLSSLAQQVLAGRALSQKQLTYAKKYIGKYAKQLYQISMNRQ